MRAQARRLRLLIYTGKVERDSERFRLFCGGAIIIASAPLDDLSYRTLPSVGFIHIVYEAALQRWLARLASRAWCSKLRRA
ncbi:hypothetical protein PSEUDO8Z_30109 [Pseudomonas sp. 8Z]|nr:hypothetical protein PSEUDO8Z_30109 [Pseudomonas sp. 8Z]